MKKPNALLIVILLLSSHTSAQEIKAGTDGRSIILTTGTTEHTYNDVLGDKNGFYRELITINGQSGIIALGRADYYYTLSKNNNITIDCIYISDRNIQNGASVSSGICNLNAPLDQLHTDIAQKHSNLLKNSVYSFDTSLILENKQSNFLLGKIGTIEVYDAYSSTEDLINSTPSKYIKSPTGCLKLKNDAAFLVFMGPNRTTPSYIDMIENSDPMTLKRLGEKELSKLSTQKCTPPFSAQESEDS